MSPSGFLKVTWIRRMQANQEKKHVQTDTWNEGGLLRRMFAAENARHLGKDARLPRYERGDCPSQEAGEHGHEGQGGDGGQEHGELVVSDVNGRKIRKLY